VDIAFKSRQIFRVLWLAAAASLLSPPEPVRPWLYPDDVRMDLVELEKPMYVRIRVAVTPAGRFHSCGIERSSGNAKLDDYTCALTRKRVRFRPARWVDGSPSWGIFRDTFWWIVTSDRSNLPQAIPGDLVLRLNSAPRRARSPMTVEVALAVDVRGRIAACEHSDEKQHPRLVALGCDQLLKVFKARPATDERGLPVRSVQTARINFEADPPRPKRREPKKEAAAPFGTAAPRIAAEATKS
jgi:TonB family protein